jgi:D-alanyl-D-alanine carboxypeptidase/D-alanyl-D-alanine-endopeptidase (penicillin-binding protein 4)
MVANEMLDEMNDEKIIDTLLKPILRPAPKTKMGRWLGLSRYNLFTPQDFVAILNKMKMNSGWNDSKSFWQLAAKARSVVIIKSDSGYIYGKTGTLSGVVAFSGYYILKRESS